MTKRLVTYARGSNAWPKVSCIMRCPNLRDHVRLKGMVEESGAEPHGSRVRLLFIRCPECRRHPITFAGEHSGTLELACERCGHQWTRPSRRTGQERRHRSAVPARERREVQRRGRLVDVPSRSVTEDEQRAHAWPSSSPEISGSSLEIRGSVSAEADLILHGHVRGSISMRHHELVIGRSGGVVGGLVARNVVVHGTVLGNITAAGGIRIETTARVKGDLASATLTIQDGAEFTGRIERAVAGMRVPNQE
jgi:cytoskeletal protein CcmA (bactofilin family)/ribosomal protein S27E